MTPRCHAGAAAEAAAGWGHCPGSPPEREMPSGNAGQEPRISYRADTRSFFPFAYEMDFPNCGASTHRNKLQMHKVSMAWSASSLPWCPAGRRAGATPTAVTLVGTLGGQWGKLLRGAHKPWKQGSWKYNPISIYFYTEMESGKKAHRAFICNHCVASRGDVMAGSAAGASLTSWDFLPFLDYLMTSLFCELSHLTLLPCQDVHNSISWRKTMRWGSKVFGHLFGNCSNMPPDLSPI